MRLYVNVDHVATVREARKTNEPDPVHAAFSAELGGADGITIHLREDRRHIQDRDLQLMMATVRTGVNLELAPSDEVLDVAIAAAPMQVTLVPERREEVTTEGGLNLVMDEPRRAVERAVERLRGASLRVSLFIDPTVTALDVSKTMGVEAVELHTGEYANARTDEESGLQLQRLHCAAKEAAARGLAVHAGHGLTYANVTPVAALPEIEELNIGHSIVARALTVGMTTAVKEMRRLVLHASARVVEPGRWIPPIGY